MSHYSARFHELFLATSRASAQELAFFAAVLPVAKFSAVLDVCSGSGRLALPLADAGHQVTAVDIDAAALAKIPPHPRLLQRCADVRHPEATRGTFDAAIMMWAGFGFLGQEDDEALLRRLAAALRPRGRLVLDVYHRGFFLDHQGTRESVVRGVPVREHQFVEGRRLTIELTYGGSDEVDRFAWDVYEPEELVAYLPRFGFAPVTRCKNFRPGEFPSRATARMQLVFETTEVLPS